MDISALNQETQSLLKTYASKPEFEGSIVKALEYLIKTYTEPEYKKLAKEWQSLRQKRLLQEEREFNKKHWDGSKSHKRFDN